MNSWQSRVDRNIARAIQLGNGFLARIDHIRVDLRLRWVRTEPSVPFSDCGETSIPGGMLLVRRGGNYDSEVGIEPSLSSRVADIHRAQ
jgi:hypothetical protein